MRTLVPLWLTLAGAGAWLRCPEGQPCPATPVLPASSAALCQDGSSCPARASCPLPEGVPCADGHHCCPRGSRCSADSKSCIESPSPRAVPCPDGQSECPDNATCCVTASGTWGCCPMPQASCCADKVHCCPHATVCDLTHGRCLSPPGDVPLGTTFPAWKRQPQHQSRCTRCCAPDGRSACSRRCYLLPAALGAVRLLSPAKRGVLQRRAALLPAGHCLRPGALHLHLVPGLGTAPGIPAQSPLSPARDVKCDNHTSCPDGSTCCQLSLGTWGCCPLEEAVCCPDHVHCCPQGYTCDPEAGSCLQEGGRRQPWVQKTPALSRVGDVKCDEETSCPDGNTCCQLSSGTWGCCPLEQAVCCPDHVHCCPQGYTCDPEAGSCLQEGGGHRPWVQKTPALSRGGDVKCDEETSCPDGNTCCRLSSGAWGCCPLEQAVCCPDHVHCCPQGYTCDPKGGSCLQEGGGHRPWVQKTPALARGGDVRCDEETSCPQGSTCCRLSSGAWGCCPLEQAVCCRDHQHCCPRGYTCNVATQSCEKLLAPTPLLRTPTSRLRAPSPPLRTPTLPPAPLRAASTQPGAAVPCDAARSCRGGQRCCRGRGGSWGCCPFTQGSCCSDGRHCCPGGSRCTGGGWGCSPQRWDLPAPRRVLL
ncbi:unnamed protein product [Bubo scandiacus]